LKNKNLRVVIAISSIPAVAIDLKQDFWSIRNHITYLADGLEFLNVCMHKVKAMPVAIGTAKQDLQLVAPSSLGTVFQH